MKIVHTAYPEAINQLREANLKQTNLPRRRRKGIGWSEGMNPIPCGAMEAFPQLADESLS
jgi:hypothetical protein